MHPTRFDVNMKNCPCCFIVPPHILQRLATSGDPNLATMAGRTLRLTQSLVAFRAQLSTGAPSPAAAKRQGLRRQVFDCKGTTDLPGDFSRSETDPKTNRDKAVNEAFDNAGTTWDFYNQIFGRESVDDHGKTLVSSVHYGQQYDNAFWDGRQMVYGDGDGVIFQRFTAALDVIAHELTHGVTQFTAQLAYQDQPGALNESMSDVFGSMVKQWSLGQSVTEADWLIGAAIMAPGFKGRALRDMTNPGTAYDDPRLGKDPQPGHMKDYVQTESDNGGVHINSGIPSRAFVIAAKAIGGKSWEKTGKIWYVTLTQRLTGNVGFEECARETVSVARDLFPEDPSIATKVAQAWADVGALEQAPTEAVFANVAGAYVISSRLREMTVARPKGPKKKAALRATPPKKTRAAPKKRVTPKKKTKSTRSRAK
jgi:Zn-dependent metalloprotease